MPADPSVAGPTVPEALPIGARRIVLCHLESLCGLPALNEIFDTLGDRIGLVLSSRRFGGRHGGVLRQVVAGRRRSGWRFTLWLGFDIVCARALSVAGAVRRRMDRGEASLGTLGELARRHGARLLEVDDVNSAPTVAAVRDYAPDLMIVMNFDQILEPEVIGVPRLGVLNIHPSLLPALRGPCPAYWALTEGRDVSGYSIHRILDETIDAGPVLVRGESKIDRSESVAEATTRLFLNGARALPEAVALLERGTDAEPPVSPAEASYRSFPTGAEVAASRRDGVRLLGVRHVVRLLRAATVSRSGRAGARAR